MSSTRIPEVYTLSTVPCSPSYVIVFLSSTFCLPSFVSYPQSSVPYPLFYIVYHPSSALSPLSSCARGGDLRGAKGIIFESRIKSISEDIVVDSQSLKFCEILTTEIRPFIFFPHFYDLQICNFPQHPPFTT